MVEKADPSGTYYADLGQSPDGASKNEFAELTPENINMDGAMAAACPYEPPPPEPPVDRYDGWKFSSFGDADGGMSCTIDGVESSCSTAMGMLTNGSGYEVALGTTYFDLYMGTPGSENHVGCGVLSTGWMPVDSFGTSRDSLDFEQAQRLASPTGQGLADNWRQQLGVANISAEHGESNDRWDTQTTSTVYGPADSRFGGSSVTVKVVFLPGPDDQFFDPGLPANLRDKVVDKMKGNCKDIFQEIIQRLEARDGKAYSTDAGEIFDRIKGFVIDPKVAGYTNGGATSQIYNGNRFIVYDKQNSPNADARATKYITNTYSELLHHAKNDGTYSDPDLDNAAKDIMSPEDYAEAMKAKKQFNQQAGMIGHKLLIKFCQ